MKSIRVYAVLFLVFGSVPTASAQSYHWHRVLTLPSGISWHSIAFNPLSQGKVIFAGSSSSEGVYRSDDGGKSWLQTTQPSDNPLNDVHQIFCVPSDTSILLAVTPNHFYRSTNGGWTWSDTSSLGGIEGEDIAFHESDDALYYGQNFGLPLPGQLGTAVWRSRDHGATWTETGFALNTDTIGLCTIDVSQDTPPLILQGSEGTSGAQGSGFIARSTDEGVNWTVSVRDDTGVQFGVEVPKVIFSRHAISPASGRHEVAVALRWRSGYRSVIGTEDGGVNWRTLRSPDRHVWALDIDQRQAYLSKSDDPAYPLPLHFFTGLFGIRSDSVTDGMVQETTDGGMSWRSTGFTKGSATDTTDPFVRQIWVLKYDTASGRIAVASNAGVYIGDPPNNRVAVQTEPDDITVSQMPGAIEIESRTAISRVRVFDLLGRAMFESSGAGPTCTIHTSSLSAGVYAVEVSGTGRLATMRMISVP